MNDIAKSIATAAIWISTAIILAFGLFKMNFSGGGSILITLTVIVVLGASVSTAKVWRN